MNKNILYGCSGLCCICLILLVLIYSLSWSGKTVKICEGKQLDIFSEEKLFQTIKVKSAHWESLIGDEGRKRIWIPTLQFRILQGTIVLPIEETQRIKLIYQW